MRSSRLAASKFFCGRNFSSVCGHQVGAVCAAASDPQSFVPQVRKRGSRTELICSRQSVSFKPATASFGRYLHLLHKELRFENKLMKRFCSLFPLCFHSADFYKLYKQEVHLTARQILTMELNRFTFKTKTFPFPRFVVT